MSEDQVFKNTEEIAYMRGKVEGIDNKVDTLGRRQDEMDQKLDTLMDQMSMARMIIFAGKAFLAGCFALLGANLDGLITVIKNLPHIVK